MEKTNEATARPWIIKEFYGRLYLSVPLEGSTSNYHAVAQVYDKSIENAELIVKAVNAYDALVEENQKLKENYNNASTVIKMQQQASDLNRESYNKLQAEKAELVEALKDLNSLVTYDHPAPNAVYKAERLISEHESKSLSREDYTKEHFTGE